MSSADDLTAELLRLIGYPLPAWLIDEVKSAFEEESDDDDRRSSFESAALMAVPLTVEPTTYEAVEDPYPTSSPVGFALGVCGLFVSTLEGPTVGPRIRGRAYAFDLNGPTDVYAVRRAQEIAVAIESYRVMEGVDAQRLGQLRRDWMEVRDPDASPDTQAARAEAFFRSHPGVAAAQELPRVVKSTHVPMPVPMPAFLSEAIAAATRIAPAFVDAEGLPELGADAKAGHQALALLVTPPDAAHREMSTLVAALAAWTAGAKDEVSAHIASLSTSERPITRRWVERMKAA